MADRVIEEWRSEGIRERRAARLGQELGHRGRIERPADHHVPAVKVRLGHTARSAGEDPGPLLLAGADAFREDESEDWVQWPAEAPPSPWGRVPSWGRAPSWDVARCGGWGAAEEQGVGDGPGQAVRPR